MKEKTLGKIFLLVAITILLVGLVSAATTNKTSTKDTKVVKDTAKTSVKTNTNTVKEPVKKVTNKKLTKNETKHQSKKSTGIENIYVTSTGTGDGKTINNPTNITNALANVNNNGVINLISSSSSDTYTDEINIQKDVSVKSGTNTFTIKGQSNKKIILKNQVYNKDLTVTFSNLNFVTTDQAIYSQSTINVENCTFDSPGINAYFDTYSNDYPNGNAIYNEGNYTTIKDSTFTNFYVTCTVSSLEAHRVGAFHPVEGGAIYNKGNYVTITNNKFKNNGLEGYEPVSTYGGAIYNNGYKATISNNNFNNNSARQGGAIYNRFDATITNNTFKNNHAKFGGAIDNEGDTATITYNTFNNNTAEEYGGAIDNYGDSTIIKNNTFNNDDAINGEEIYNNADNVTITYNTFENEYESYDGVIEDQGKDTTISDNTFKVSEDEEPEDPEDEEPEEYPNKTKTTTKTTIKLSKTKLYKGSKVKATVTLKDNKGKILKNQKVTIKFGSKTYTIKTNSKGVATKVYKTTKTGT
ncbi:MAG: right-handed parallel beta-helix repeat-containing protein, partial [Methanosphaera sp.]|nr:right-handed parallel beta-helix repeat-containing protein [Methanosphaera sp.]